ncbi:hypothetical protein LFYK43_01310 [Ligilactobacillus salitolerans]|uniref:VOC domain-containing protein n=1 Tax=Ligilactobacillus salitolerans TaxID=1808352 RepID=A0A401IQ67_9LACO|nr:VOC family protein [Ligilactobacillus salitolerans]GBG93672.1 hypothetical protein LFYK43_01310 [Ligilactobacillus salitolerans]
MDNTGIVDHLEIYVSDLPKTRAFWDLLLVQNFHYQVYQEWDTGISYRLKETYIVFVQTDKTSPAFNRTRVGLNHLAFSVPTNEAVDRIREQILTAQYPELYPSRYPHAGGPESYAFYCEDPDRIKVEVVSQQH